MFSRLAEELKSYFLAHYIRGDHGRDFPAFIHGLLQFIMDHPPGDVPVLCCVAGVARLSASHIATVSHRLSRHIDLCPSRGELTGRCATARAPPRNAKKRSNVNRELRDPFPVETDRPDLANRLSAVMPGLEPGEIPQWTIRRDLACAAFAQQPTEKRRPIDPPPPPANEPSDGNANYAPANAENCPGEVDWTNEEVSWEVFWPPQIF
jgi:hypothetical protein